MTQAVGTFVYGVGWQEKDLNKCAKLDTLRLVDDEWENAGKFADILLVQSPYVSLSSY